MLTALRHLKHKAKKQFLFNNHVQMVLPRQSLWKEEFDSKIQSDFLLS